MTMTDAVVVPSDRYAEEVVVGCAIATRGGANLASGRLEPSDFYWPAHARLFDAAIAITDVDSERDRTAICAARADVPEADVEALLARRAVQWDLQGSYAARVFDAARRRRVAHYSEAAYRRILEGGSLDEALSLLRAAS